MFRLPDRGYILASASYILEKERLLKEATFNLATTLGTAFTAVQGDVTSVLAVVIPIAIGIAGIVFVARKAMAWFKGMAK